MRGPLRVLKSPPNLELAGNGEPPTEDETLELQRGAWADQTNEKYDAMMRVYRAFCEETQRRDLPGTPETAAAFIADLMIRRQWTHNRLQQASAAVNRAHSLAGLPCPMDAPGVALLIKAARRNRGPVKQARPLTPEELRLMIRSLDERPISVRDRALLLVGFAGALRASELLALEVDDLDWRRQGVVLKIRSAKGDRNRDGQEALAPRVRDAELCPFLALRELGRLRNYAQAEGRPVSKCLFAASDPFGELIHDRPLSGRAWRKRLPQLAEAAGISTEGLSTHSLRAGMATAALERGVDLPAVARLGRWSDVRQILTYDRRQRWSDNAAAQVLVATGEPIGCPAG